MDTHGVFFVDRITAATNIKTHEKISKTFESVKGFLLPERTAITNNYSTNAETHKTRIVEEGFLFEEHFAETRITAKNNNTIIRSKENSRYIIY